MREGAVHRVLREEAVDRVQPSSGKEQLIKSARNSPDSALIESSGRMDPHNPLSWIRSR
jgi:hypothetical protein